MLNEVVQFAWPLLRDTVAKTELPFLNVTDPVGVVPLPATIDVNVTDWPTLLGLVLELRVILTLPLLIFCIRTGEVLG